MRPHSLPSLTSHPLCLNVAPLAAILWVDHSLPRLNQRQVEAALAVEQLSYHTPVAIAVMGGDGDMARRDAAQMDTAQTAPGLLIHLGGINAVEPHPFPLAIADGGDGVTVVDAFDGAALAVADNSAAIPGRSEHAAPQPGQCQGN